MHISLSLLYVYLILILSHKLSDFNWEQMMRSRSVKVFNTDSSPKSTNLYTTVSTSVCTYIMCVCVCVCVCMRIVCVVVCVLYYVLLSESEGVPPSHLHLPPLPRGRRHPLRTPRLVP